MQKQITRVCQNNLTHSLYQQEAATAPPEIVNFFSLADFSSPASLKEGGGGKGAGGGLGIKPHYTPFA